MLAGEPVQGLSEDVSHLGRVLDDPLLAERLDRGDADGTRERMPAVREPACEHLVADPRSDRLADRHRSEGDIAGVNALGQREDVGHDVPMVDGEPPSGASEAGHHLVRDQEDAVLVAGLADRLQIAVWGNDDPVRSRDRLENHRGDGVRSLVLQDLFEVRRTGADRARIGMPAGQR